MGKGQSGFAKRLRTGTKKNAVPKLETEFTCPFCNSHKSVQCTIQKIKTMERSSIGVAECLICKASYRTSINHLTKPIDVYSEWLDECERVNDSYQDHQALEPMQSPREWTPPGYDRFDDEEDEEEDDVMPSARVRRRMK